MSGIGDDRVAFYLANREQIQEWAKLGYDAANAVHAVFAQLGERLAATVSELSIPPELVFFDEGFVEYQLYEPAWGDRQPAKRVPVGVTLGMNRNTVLTQKRVPAVYVGVRVDTDYPGAADRHAALAAALTTNPLCEERPLAMWPGWRWVPMRSTQWWEERDEFAETLSMAFRSAWDAFAPIIRHVLLGT